jgi:hypothetical protein
MEKSTATNSQSRPLDLQHAPWHDMPEDGHRLYQTQATTSEWDANNEKAWSKIKNTLHSSLRLRYQAMEPMRAKRKHESKNAHRLQKRQEVDTKIAAKTASFQQRQEVETKIAAKRSSFQERQEVETKITFQIDGGAKRSINNDRTIIHAYVNYDTPQYIYTIKGVSIIILG